MFLNLKLLSQILKSLMIKFKLLPKVSRFYNKIQKNGYIWLRIKATGNGKSLLISKVSYIRITKQIRISSICGLKWHHRTNCQQYRKFEIWLEKYNLIFLFFKKIARILIFLNKSDVTINIEIMNDTWCTKKRFMKY